MIPNPVAFRELQQEREQKLKIKLNYIQYLTVMVFLFDTSICNAVVECVDFACIDSSPMVPDCVVLRVDFE
jgi:hypothetical protein